ncbi:MAG: phosphoribosylpyrophosphate synthetase [Sphingobacteriaceae bacterium]
MTQKKDTGKTLSQVVNELVKTGYTTEFVYERNSVYCEEEEGKCFLSPQDLVITQIYRFEGMTDPSDSAVVYALESSRGKKGLLIDAYGAYADEHKVAFLKNIPIREST